MSRRKKLLILLLIICFVGIGLSSVLHRGFWSVLVVSELLRFESQGWLGNFSSSPAVREISYAGPKGKVKADLYLPQPPRQCAGILLNHGVIDTGKDDPRLKRIAGILSRAGFAVFVPEFTAMRSLHIGPEDVDEIQAAFSFFQDQRKYLLPGSCGLFGFSYGAGPTLIAACRPAIREKVRFAVSFGGYYDLRNVISFLATGSFEYRGKWYSRKPQEYGKWLFLVNNLELVKSPQDRSVLERIARLKLRDEHASIQPYLSLLGAEGKNVLALLSHSDPRQTPGLIQALAPAVRASLEKLSVAPVLQDLRADLILAHGESDDLIPFTETLRLARAAPDPRRVFVRILRSYSHVDAETKPLTLEEIKNFYLPEGWKLFRLVYRLMEYGR